MNYLCILSAGKGTRLGLNKNKGLIEIGGKTMLDINIENFSNMDEIDQILVVTDQDSQKEINDLLKAYNLSKLIDQSILGGKQRQDSAYNAIKYLSSNIKSDDIVLMHNVANLFVSHKDVTQLISEAKESKASVLGRKVTNTIRKVNDSLSSIELVERENLYEMETPQAIRADIAIEAFEKAYEKGYYGTDDVSLVEKLGLKVKIVETSMYNFKITTKKDYYLAQYLLDNNII